MSKMCHWDAKLEGYRGPFYPWGVGRLAERLNGTMNGASLRKIGEKLPDSAGFAGLRRPISTDGYPWFWALVFNPKGEGYDEVLIAIPWAQDWEETDGVRWDRSIAVYIQGSGNGEQIIEILRQLIDLATQEVKELED